MFNILLCGVGGQGTVLASKMLANCAINRGETAHTAETIGMAQRGGSVVSHVRIGSDAFSPLIPKGCADTVIAFEPAECVRVLPYLKNDGQILVNTLPVKPTTDTLARTSYEAADMFDFLDRQGVDYRPVDGAAILNAVGSARSLNVALLGAASAMGAVPCTLDELETVIHTAMKPQFCEQNLKALRFGAALLAESCGFHGNM